MFESNMKKISMYGGSKYDMGAYISSIVDTLKMVKKLKPPETGNKKLYELQLAQYVKNRS
jgi:hypothetical protein